VKNKKLLGVIIAGQPVSHTNAVNVVLKGLKQVKEFF
jgi:hypothetical protein